MDYHDTHFSFTIAKDGPVVIVLAQLDDRYFRGLEGQYRYELSFRLHKAGQKDYIVRSQTPYRMTRSCNIELELEAGEYEVRVKVNAVRLEYLLPVEDVVRNYAKDRRDKLVRMGLAYDLAHSKGRIVETPAEKAAREAYEKKEKTEKRAEIRKKLLANREEGHYMKIKQWHREVRAHEKAKLKKKAKLEAKKAKKEAKKAAKAAEKLAKKEAESQESEAKVEIEIKIEPPTETEQVPEVSDDVEVKSEPEIKQEPDVEEVAVKKEESDEKPVEVEKTETKAEEKPATETVAETKADVAAPVKEEKKDDSTSPEDTPSTGSDNTTSAVETTEEKATESAPDAEVKAEEEESAPVSESDEKPEETTEESEEKSEETQDAPEENQVEEEEEEEAESESEEESDDDIESVGSLSELSEREIEIHIDSNIPPESEAGAPSEEDPDEFEQDPWNAVAVVGLRVYYKPGNDDKPDEVLKLKVIRPIRYADNKEGKEKVEGKECETTGLDVDDSAKDATLEGEVTDRKKSIMGDGRKRVA